MKEKIKNILNDILSVIIPFTCGLIFTIIVAYNLD